MYYGRMSLASILRLRCPVCGKGKIFDGLLRYARALSALRLFLHEGKRLLSAACRHRLSGYDRDVAGRLAVLYFAGVRSTSITLAVMIAVALGFGIWFIRYAKMLWLAFDLYMHPAVKEDFDGRGRNSRGLHG